MHLFNVTVAETSEELCVAARTTDHAAEVFVTFWIARTGSAPGEFSLGRGAPNGYRSHHVAEDVAAGEIAGIVVRQPDGSMLFEPAIG
jgi:hypothetical protein